MSHVLYNNISAEETGQRLDNYLIRILKGVPKSHVYRIIRAGEVRINKKRAKPSARVELGDCIRIPPVRIAKDDVVYVSAHLAKNLNKAIIFEDHRLLVINKPAGLAVHGGSGISLGVIEALRNMRRELTYLELVHRLDRETSGCLLIAKKRSALRALQALFVSRSVKKTYWALVDGAWKGDQSQQVDAALQKNTLLSGERMVKVNSTGKPSETSFKLLENYQHNCWIAASPKTGRTHQIRVHSAYLGHPIIGDEKYGYCPKTSHAITINAARLYLHARTIAFNFEGNDHYYQAEIDENFSLAITQLRAKDLL